MLERPKHNAALRVFIRNAAQHSRRNRNLRSPLSLGRCITHSLCLREGERAMRIRTLLIMLAVVVAIVRAGEAQTQITTAVIEGVVVDPSGAVLLGVDVEVR